MNTDVEYRHAEEEEEALAEAEESNSSGPSTPSSDDAEEEEAEELDDDEDDDEEEEEEEETQVEVYPLPPLPPAHPPARIQNMNTAEVYSVIKELRRQLDDPVEREHATAMLRGDSDALLAVAQVLHEANLLRRSTVNEHGQIEEQFVPQPAAPRPALPNGYSSWIVEMPQVPQ